MYLFCQYWEVQGGMGQNDLQENMGQYYTKDFAFWRGHWYPKRLATCPCGTNPHFPRVDLSAISVEGYQGSLSGYGFMIAPGHTRLGADLPS